MIEDRHIIPEYARYEIGKWLEQYIDITDDEYSYSSESIILNALLVLVKEGYFDIKTISKELSQRIGRMITTGMIEEWVKEADKIFKTETLKPEQIFRRDTSGKFESDMTKDEKCKLVVQMRESGMKDEEIAAELGLKYDSVRKYAALYEKNAKPQEVKPKEPVKEWWDNEAWGLTSGGY